MKHVLLDERGDVLDIPVLTASRERVILEIGFGGGQELIDTARSSPTDWIIGVEVHTPGIARVLAAVEAGLANVSVVDGDALVFLDRLSPMSLHGVRLFFPDPWPKVRQRGRRLVQRSNVDRLVDRLTIGGTLHLATDVENYARQMIDVCRADARLEGGQVERPGWRPITRFEARAHAEGRRSVDLVFERVRA